MRRSMDETWDELPACSVLSIVAELSGYSIYDLQPA